MTTTQPGSGDRIAKLLARAGIASRREIERMIDEGRIAIDGVVIDTPATILDSLTGVTVDGNPVAEPELTRLFLYHKPPGLLVTEHDPAGRPIIYDRLPADLPRLVPVGRLDLATEGLLLMTTDGGFKRLLELPATGVERTYRARAYGEITQARLEDLIHGIEIEGMRYGSINANLERRTGANFWIEMTLTEGKNREVRRVLEYLGLQVSRLIRTRYGPFVLGDLQPGELGEARGVDIAEFRRSLDGKKRTRGQPQELVEVEARKPTPPPAPPTPVQAPERAERAPRPATTTAPAPRATRDKPATGWGSRTRPSRPVEPDGPRSRTRPVPAPRPSEDVRAAFHAAEDRPRSGFGARPQGEQRGRFADRSAPQRTRREGDERPRAAPGRFAAADQRTRPSDQSRQRRDGDDRPRAAPGRFDQRQRTDGDQRPRFSDQARPQRPRREGDERPQRPRRDGNEPPRRDGGDRPRASAAAPGRTPVPGEGFQPRRGGPAKGGKGPAGGRGHPPRDPKGKPRGGKR